MNRKRMLFIILSILVSVIPLFTACAEPQAQPQAEAPAESPAEVILLKYSSFGQLEEAPTRIAYEYLDYIERGSGGSIKFERYPGAILGTVMEQAKLVGSGTVNLATVLCAIPELPLGEFPLYAVGSDCVKTGSEITNKIMFDIPETSALLEEEWTENNFKLMFTNAIGIAGVILRSSANSLADLKGKKIGQMGASKSLIQARCDGGFHQEHPKDRRSRAGASTARDG